MGTKKPAKIKPAELREAFKADLASCWQHAKSLHPDRTPYAFVLHGLEGTPHLYPYVLTEEGLTEVAKRYVAEGYYETLEEARKELRYSMADSPCASELEEQLPTVDALMEPVEEDLDEEEGYELLAKAAIQAFTALDKKGTFGQGKQRESLLLLIDTGESEFNWAKTSAKELNSPAAFRRFGAETKIEGIYASSDAIAISPGGRLYFTGNRASKPGRDPNISEIVACDVMGPRLKRRWELAGPSKFGQSSPHIACADDGTLFVLRRKYQRRDCTTTLVRFDGGNKDSIREKTLEGEPWKFAVSADGSRIAIGMRSLGVYILNEKLEVIQIVNPTERLWLLHFLKTGEMLGITEKGIVRIDAKYNISATPCKDNVLKISMDARQTLCAVTKRMPNNKLHSDQKPSDQYGFNIFELPKMKLFRTFEIPAHQLNTATLSSDGKLVACEASECGKSQSHIVVFETATGKEIARKKSDGFPEMAFLPGKEVLALTKSGYLKSEPVTLWKIR